MISRNILFLAFLYFLQGLPYGLQSRFLPLYFRTHGMSLSDIGFFKLLLIPWMLKALWAPFVDRYGSKRQWLSYSMLGLCLCCLMGSATSPDHVIELAGVLFLFNLLTATQDIAVDGIAIQVLLTSELASGNIAQVVGYKVGAVFSGGFLTWLSETLNISWGGLFVSLCGAYLAAYFCVISTIPSQDADKINAYLEESIEVTNTDKSKPKKQTSNKLDAENKQEAKSHWFIEHILQVVETDETKWMLLYVLLYKLGEQGTLSMVPLFLVDHGIPAASVGFWTGVIGQCLSIGGSVLGGWMVTYYGWTPFQIVKLFSRFRIIPLVAVTSIVWYYDNLSINREEHPDQRLLVSMVICMCVMLLGSGIVTTTTFTLMMYCSQKSSPIIQASHYTTLATVEVLGKLTFSVLIGSLTDLIGYSLVFSLFIMLGLVVLPVLMKCPKSLVDMNSNENKNS